MTTKLDFIVIPTGSCKNFAIADTSYYNDVNPIESPTMQILPPGYIEPVELNYIPNGLTIVNSNLLKISNTFSSEMLFDLPDGAYTIKLSICPHDMYWVEKTYYNTCRLECKYHKAILKTDLDKCSACLDKNILDTLTRIRVMMDGIQANASQCNIKRATEIYNKVDKMLNKIIECDC